MALNTIAMEQHILKAVRELVQAMRKPAKMLAVSSEKPRIIPLTNLFPSRFVTFSMVSQYPLLIPAAMRSIILINSQLAFGLLLSPYYLSDGLVGTSCFRSVILSVGAYSAAETAISSISLSAYSANIAPSGIRPVTPLNLAIALKASIASFVLPYESNH